MAQSLLILGCSATQAAIAPHQREALIDLYQATQGSQWRQATQWLQGDPCEQHWHGVVCSTDGASVLKLQLPGNRLQGGLPESFAALDTLETLDLRGNLGLTGPLPPLHAFAALVQLNLSFNQFTGHLPVKLRLPALQSLVLSNNLLNGEIPELSGLPALQNLRLNHNQFSGTMPSLSALSALEAVDISFNQLTGRLPELAPLPRLTSFVADWNHFQGPLPNPSGLLMLHTLSVSGNRLTGPLPPLLDLPTLSVLAVGHNRMSGPLPRVLELPQISDLNLAYNLFTGPLPDLSALTQLKRLQTEGNPLTLATPCVSAQVNKLPAPTDKTPAPGMGWSSCEDTETSTSTDASSASAFRHHATPGRINPVHPSTNTRPNCPPGTATRASPDKTPYAPCPTPSPRRGAMGLPSREPLSGDTLLSDWIMALSALLAMVTLTLIWRLSWRERKSQLPPSNDPAQGLANPRDSWPHGRAPLARVSVSVRHKRPRHDPPSTWDTTTL